MNPNRHRDFKLDIWGVVLLLPLAVVPLVTADTFLNSLTYQCAIGVSAALAVYITLRLGLLSFTVPAFMAVGGYAAAMLAKAGMTDLLVLMGVSFIIPALVAIPLGAIVLRLKGVYFIIITFLFNEILQLVIFETPTLTGGADGIPDVPSATLFGHHLGSSSMLILVTVAICLIATLITLFVTQWFRAEFTSIDENETLAESLGVAVWKYRTIGFVASAGVSGLAGFALVNMLATAHPSSFASWSINNYIAYAFVGGRGSMLGIVVGSLLLIVMTNIFSGYASFSAGLFGLLLVVVMMAAPGGLVGTCMKLFSRRKAHVDAQRKSMHWRKA
ncbi:leucine/isoleucine/valine transporter permease subunit [Burkholderia lata]|uniref:branched-chain amino acid ABC transporter permease n=1 Tax=Burkholderia lata (strain ATCC 17760 / DSM 23089 / LMG 22485 / NCIMB 9086 / R18194 / 383) TaxID=482957 RepID=UPI00145357D5|nr:branched-chain amino acid ABC transporter permease [Burkholderia lata]VWB18730.1 leucine/isoleucine/valine transporter permease subunit [Burkholderia lata]